MGRTPPRKPQESAIFGTPLSPLPRGRGRVRGNPQCFPASLFPTSLALIGRLHGDRDLSDTSCDSDVATAALRSSQERTGKTGHPARPRRRMPSSRSSLHALIGRPGARKSFWGACQSTPLAPRAVFSRQAAAAPQGAATRPPICVWCRLRAATATTEPRGANETSSLRDSPMLTFKPSNQEEKRRDDQTTRY